jgi:hypothetical protein
MAEASAAIITRFCDVFDRRLVDVFNDEDIVDAPRAPARRAAKQ